MSVRIVSLHSDAASDPRMEGTPDARVHAVTELTLLAWRLAGRSLPVYTREDIPVVQSTLREQGDDV